MCLRFLSLLLFFSCAQAGELRVCADPDNLPYSKSDGSGFENRIAALVAGELQATLAYAWHPQQRAFVRKTVGAKLCDVWIGVPADFERLLTTRPYYRSSYVFVFRSERPLQSFDAPDLKHLRIGVQLPGDDLAATPPGHALVLRGAIANVVGFPVHGAQPSAERIAHAIARGELDAAVVWGPQAGFYAREKRLAIREAKPPADLEAMPFAFSIAMGVRRGEAKLRDALDAAIERRRAEIEAILDQYAVPRL